MSYAMAGVLQQAVYARLRSDEALSALVGEAIYDAVPPGPLPDLYVTLGEEQAADASDKGQAGARHEFVVSVLTDAPGFQRAKDAAAAVSDALVGKASPPDLARGRIVGLWFLKARARRRDGVRRIDLTFRARVDET